jgi:cephalosporin hydroxylase
MKVSIDTDAAIVVIDDANGRRELPMASAEAFEAASAAWLRVGWDVKHTYSFTWLGRPIIQLPEDMIRLQEVIYRLRPDVIVECGVAHGGGVIFCASLCRLMDKGRVIGVEVELRPHNRRALATHPLADRITIVDGSSTAPETVARVAALIAAEETVLVLLDANHSKAHVTAELDAYSPLVTPGSYIVAMDGVMELVAGGPRTAPDWAENNPRRAALDWVEDHPEFVIEEPPFAFNEGLVRRWVTYWPDAFLKRLPAVG